MSKRPPGKRKAKGSKDPSAAEQSPSGVEIVASSRVALLVLALVVAAVYFRVFGAGFVEYDDDVHVYANPFLNPPSLESVGKLWQHAYVGLYIPLAYSILAGIAAFAAAPSETTSSIGQAITLEPDPFHVASVGLHFLNAWLVFLLALRITRSKTAALLGSLVFAVHPLAVESVAWISELRGLSSASFALAALNVFVLARDHEGRAPAKARTLLGVTAVLVMGAMLCKPAAVALPLALLVVDRVALGTPWRRAIVTALAWVACVLPFALVTRAVQQVYPEGMSLFWQRPFIAGDALAFYLQKTALPIDLGVEYGRTPASVLSSGWGYVVWVLPLGLLALGFVERRRRPVAWLGSLMFGAFLLPTLGIVPFSFQAHSTVADRYAYLAMIGIGLVVADVVSALGSTLVLRVAGAVLVVLGIRSFDQTSYWVDNRSFLLHTIEVNPDVAFAHNNLGAILLKEKRVDEAIDHLKKALETEPDHALAQNNLGLALVQEGRLNEAEPHLRKAVELDPSYFKAYENLGAIYLRTNRLAEAITSLQKALEIKPSEAKALNDLGIAFMQSGRHEEGLDAFRRAVELEPNNAQYKKNLEIALSQH